MATPSVLSFDAEGRAVNFEVWVDDLQLFLQCDRADGLSLFDLTSCASPPPPATADSTLCSHWARRNATARLAVRRHLSTAERAHFSQYKTARTFRPALRLPLAGDGAPARAREARALEGLARAVEVAVEEVEGVGVMVGAVAGLEVSVAAVEAEEAVAAAVELVVALRRGVGPVVVNASSSSAVSLG
ncbi:unnamed protein product [Closterium sp. NIES-65]|nr:unnamed protein product [Closterium sp. NIES-65]